MTPAAIYEDREFRRVPVDLLVFAQVGEARPADAAVDLSEQGMRLLTAQPLEKGARCRFGLRLEDDAPIELTGEVVWSRKNSMGVCFDQVDDRVVCYLARVESTRPN